MEVRLRIHLVTVNKVTQIGHTPPAPSKSARDVCVSRQLLTVACETPPRGHKQVMEAASTLRLRFGEPVRFKFLVGMLTSFGSPR